MNYDDKGQPNNKLCSLEAGFSWVILPLICTRLLPTPATQSITRTLPWRWRMMSVMAYVHVSICLCCHNVLFLCCHNVYMWPQWCYSAFAVLFLCALDVDYVLFLAVDYVLFIGFSQVQLSIPCFLSSPAEHSFWIHGFDPGQEWLLTWFEWHTWKHSILARIKTRSGTKPGLPNEALIFFLR